MACLPTRRRVSRAASICCVVVTTGSIVAGCGTTTPTAPTHTNYGLLTNESGMTLYTFDRDATGSGKSVCNGPCAASWPAFPAPVTALPTDDYTVVIRDDGSRQWAFKGKPLYTFSRDGRPGEKNGDGILGNQWHVVRP